MVSTLKRKFGTISAYLSFTPRSQIETRNKNENLENDVSYLRKNFVRSIFQCLHVQFIQFRVITISIERREDKKFTRRKKYRSLYADLRYCSTYETTRKDRLDSRWIQNWIETSSCDD